MAPQKDEGHGHTHTWSSPTIDMTEADESAVVGVLSIQENNKLYLNNNYIGNTKNMKVTMKQLSKEIAKHLLRA